MRNNPALFTQQAESNAHVQSRSISQINKKGETQVTDNNNNNDKEQEVNQIANEALNLAAPFIPGGPVAVKVAQLSGLAPEVIHLGFVFAHLFSHSKVAPIVAASAAVPAPAPAPDPKASAIAAIQAQMKELQDKLANLQNS